eukprot:TRINITY_DN210_c0_g1_i1.p1 TRINITY_DN210_c0_g1~~TRINITY_DN210_c0_g1_i1.p1  ORF type:complete len:310 (-),score=76.89 TRINITY_DN210_c0_g1_i1:4-933(-)
MSVYYNQWETAWGWIHAECDEEGNLVQLVLPQPRHESFHAELAKDLIHSPTHFEELKEKTIAYFKGEKVEFDTIPIHRRYFPGKKRLRNEGMKAGKVESKVEKKDKKIKRVDKPETIDVKAEVTEEGKESPSKNCLEKERAKHDPMPYSLWDCVEAVRHYRFHLRFDGEEATSYETYKSQLLREVQKEAKYGMEMTYGEIAGDGARSAARNLMDNPVPLVVPCHRISSSLKNPPALTWSDEVKERMCILEGIKNKFAQKKKKPNQGKEFSPKKSDERMEAPVNHGRLLLLTAAQASFYSMWNEGGMKVE